MNTKEELNGYKIRVTRLSIAPSNEPLFSELCTHLSIEDDAAGEYVTIQQQLQMPDVKEQKIQIDPEEWQALKYAVEKLLQEIETNEELPPEPETEATGTRNKA